MQYAVLLKNNQEYLIEAERYNECDENFLRFYDKNGREMAFYKKTEVIGIRTLDPPKETT